jgi:ribonuclease H2 subunit C
MLDSPIIGVIATPTERVLPASQRQSNETAEDDVSEVEEPVKVLGAQGTFDEMMVWGHEILPAADDAFVKGVEEWVRFAETVCASPRTSMNMVSELTLLIDARVGGAS